jgi:hypothetical protein
MKYISILFIAISLFANSKAQADSTIVCQRLNCKSLTPFTDFAINYMCPTWVGPFIFELSKDPAGHSGVKMRITAKAPHGDIVKSGESVDVYTPLDQQVWSTDSDIQAYIPIDKTGFIMLHLPGPLATIGMDVKCSAK